MALGNEDFASYHIVKQYYCEILIKTRSAEFGEGRVFMHATNLNAAPTVSPMIAASTGDQDGVTPISSWVRISKFCRKNS